MHVSTDSLKINEGSTYTLKQPINGNAYGVYYFESVYSGASNTYITGNSSWASGELTISKLDTVNQIMSGTFWYNAIDNSNDSIQITDGRFDLHYTL